MQDGKAPVMTTDCFSACPTKCKRKGRPILEFMSIGSGAGPSLQAIRWVDLSHEPDGRLPLLSARPAVTFPARQHYSPLAGTKLYCLVTEAHVCKQLAQSCYPAATSWSLVRRPNHYTTEPHQQSVTGQLDRKYSHMPIGRVHPRHW